MKDARAALDALREEERERKRREAEEAERLRQIQMREKLEVMRKKKQEYLQVWSVWDMQANLKNWKNELLGKLSLRDFYWMGGGCYRRMVEHSQNKTKDIDKSSVNFYNISTPWIQMWYEILTDGVSFLPKNEVL